MSDLGDARDRYLEAYRALESERGDEPAWLGRLRGDAIAAFRETGLPSTRLEEWRYTNVAPLAALPFEVLPPRAAGLGRDELEAIAFPLFACGLYVFEDGRARSDVSAERAHSRNGERRGEPCARSASAPERRLSGRRISK